MRPRRSGFFKPGATVAAIARAEGALALWNGFLPYYGRCGGHTVAMFIAVEELRAFYRKMNK